MVREGEHPLLGAVVEVALEPSSLFVGRGGDSGPRRPERLQTGEHLGLKALVLDREARGGPDLTREARSVDGRVVEHGSDDLSCAGHRRHSVSSSAGGIAVSVPSMSTIVSEPLSR